VLQAMAGFMEITGDPAGPPMVTGVPIVDLKAGDEVYANVLLALAERAKRGRAGASTCRCCRPRRRGSSPRCR